jgi:hypothetical protein
MGYITDGELEFEDEQYPVSPPNSPRLAATHAQAIAEKVASINSDPGKYLNIFCMSQNVLIH